MARHDETIVACATARGRAGVAIVRVSGARAGHLARAIGGRATLVPRHATHTRFHCPQSGEMIDRGVLVWFEGPASYTGEDCAEFHCHGSPAVIDRLIAACTSEPQCRVAEPGEFTERAFLAGRMDLTQVEGLHDLIEAETDEQRRQALRIADGGLYRRIEDLSERLGQALALIEASLDFSDEDDVARDAEDRASGLAHDVRSDIEILLSGAKSAEAVRRGFRIVLAGAPNVGKSSLLNALAGRDAVIVSDVEGTTRDLHDVQMVIDGFSVTFTDTAGLRESEDPIEREGARRARVAMTEADLVWWIRDLSMALDRSVADAGTGGAPNWVIGNKADIAGVGNAGIDHAVSARTGAGLNGLLDALGTELRERTGALDQRLVVRGRQMDCLRACARCLADFGPETLPELKAESMRQALGELERLTGRQTPDDILGRIFTGFCIGK